MTIRTDVAILGGGAAGLYAACCAAAQGARVALVCAGPSSASASHRAQGGLAAALGAGDSPRLHRHDTERAGRGLVRRSAADVLVSDAGRIVADLMALGVHFDTDRADRLALGLEGGHSKRRIVHAGGATGSHIVERLTALVAQDRCVRVLDNARAGALWLRDDGSCAGVVLADGRAIAARATILATGGAAALWARTTAPVAAVGSGIRLAHAAGAALADLEFLQFHPTAVAGIRGLDGYLVSEAVRGEGAVLVGADGERFVDELAPRDSVARAVTLQMRRDGATHVHLDMRMVDPGRFPTIVARLAAAGLDAMKEPVPVSPAAHHFTGGVVADGLGRTTVPSLYAIGEASCTGLHGANRLASNSLTECFVWGRRAALAALDEPDGSRARVPAPMELPPPSPQTRAALSQDAGIERSHEGLSRLLDDPHPLVRLVAGSALARRESRGAHFRTDHPRADPALDGCHSVIRGDGELAHERWDVTTGDRVPSEFHHGIGNGRC